MLKSGSVVYTVDTENEKIIRWVVRSKVTIGGFKYVLEGKSGHCLRRHDEIYTSKDVAEMMLTMKA